MYRHALALASPTWTAAAAPAGPPAETWPDDGWVAVRHAAGHRVRFRAALTAELLELAAEVEAPAGFVDRSELHPEWYLREHVLFFLDPGNGHLVRRMVAVGRDGRVECEDILHFMGEEVGDVQKAKLEAPPLAPAVAVAATAAGWRVRIAIARATLGLRDGGPEGGVPIGLHARYSCTGDELHEPAHWPPAAPWWSDNPFTFADLLPAGAPLAVEHVDFGEPVWRTGPVGSQLALIARLAAGTPRTGRCRVTVVHADGQGASVDHPWRARGRTLRLDVPVDYPFTSKWTTHALARNAHVGVDLLDAAGRLLWHGSWPFGFDGGVIVREPYGRIPDRAPWNRRPAPERPDFVDAHRAWLLTQLPAWKPRTTRQGAPSDFFLQARRREDSIDLMRPTVLRDLARLIRRRFSDWQDGLCAASLLLHHPCLTVHSPVWAKPAATADCPSILRLGGCFCSETARLAAALADELGRLYRVPLRGAVLGLRGHLTGIVDTPLGEVLIDPMLGLWYHTLDNRRLATLAEMREDARIATRMWTLPEARGHRFFDGVRNQVKRPPAASTISYP